MALAGAGGGGFLYAITKESNSKERIEGLIASSKLDMKIFDAKISYSGIEVNFL